MERSLTLTPRRSSSPQRRETRSMNTTLCCSHEQTALPHSISVRSFRLVIRSRREMCWLILLHRIMARSLSATTPSSLSCHGPVTTTKTLSSFQSAWSRTVSGVPSTSKSSWSTFVIPSLDQKSPPAIFQTLVKQSSRTSPKKVLFASVQKFVQVTFSSVRFHQRVKHSLHLKSACFDLSSARRPAM